MPPARKPVSSKPASPRGPVTQPLYEEDAQSASRPAWKKWLYGQLIFSGVALVAVAASLILSGPRKSAKPAEGETAASTETAPEPEKKPAANAANAPKPAPAKPAAKPAPAPATKPAAKPGAVTPVTDLAALKGLKGQKGKTATVSGVLKKVEASASGGHLILRFADKPGDAVIVTLVPKTAPTLPKAALEKWVGKKITATGLVVDYKGELTVSVGPAKDIKAE